MVLELALRQRRSPVLSRARNGAAVPPALLCAADVAGGSKADKGLRGQKGRKRVAGKSGPDGYAAIGL